MKRITALALVAAMATPAAALAQSSERGFDGLYAGVEVGLENVIGGALVGGVDTLAQASRPTVGVFAGYRRQFDNGLVLGVEGGLAWEDGSLSLDSGGAHIEYENAMHWRYGGTVGWAVDPDTLLFAYVSETKRDFDVAITQGPTLTRQTDEQGLLRYGLGLERSIGDWGVRASIGSSRADFGDRPTNVSPDHPVDGNLGLVRHF